MTATFNEAKDDILAIFHAAWGPTGNTTIYDNKDGEVPADNEPWARVAVRHATGSQASLSGGLGGQIRWERNGVLMVQIFTAIGEGTTNALTLAKLVADAYEGVASPLNVWFRNVRLNEIGADGNWFQVNVLVDFTYDEVK